MLTITGITKTYATGVRALDDVCLSIPPGVFGLLGQNGAGKTTLMRVLATLMRPERGSVDLFGLDLLQNPAAARMRLGYLPQEFGVYPRCSAERMLDHIAALKGLNDARGRARQVDRRLRQVNLSEVRRQRLGTFSGGMKRRFGIAQALIGDPRLLIVDEPTAGLDPGERNRFYDLLSELGESRVVILATHLVEDVRSVCRTMAIMADGRVLIAGDPEQIIASYAGKIWTKVVPRSELDAIRSAWPVISVRPVRGEPHVQVYCTEHPGYGFEGREPTLEDAYFAELLRHKRPGTPP